MDPDRAKMLWIRNIAANAISDVDLPKQKNLAEFNLLDGCPAPVLETLNTYLGYG